MGVRDKAIRAMMHSLIDSGKPLELEFRYGWIFVEGVKVSVVRQTLHEGRYHGMVLRRYFEVERPPTQTEARLLASLAIACCALPTDDEADIFMSRPLP